MPTIRERMLEFNALVRLAAQHNISRGPDGRLRELTNLRVSNEQASARVAALRNYLVGRNVNVPAQITLLPPPQQTELGNIESSPQSIALALLSTPTPPRRWRRRLRSDQAPAPATSTVPTFGIELECLFPTRLTPAAVATALAAVGVPCQTEFYNHATRGYWKIVTDGSLRSNPGTNAYEIVSPILTGEGGLEAIHKVCTTLQDLGAIVNRSCGLHVHVGVNRANDNPSFFKRLASLYSKHNPLIEQMLAPSRRGSANLYCRPFRSFTDAQLDACRTVSDVIHLVNGNNPRMDRYFKLNLNSYFRHRTVEFRQHQGTLDANKAKMWTRFCLKMMAAAAKTEAVTATDLDSLLTGLEASDDERTYFLTRRDYFIQLEAQGDH